MRLPRVCVAVIGSDGNEMAERAESLVRDNSLLEFRLDYLSKPGLALPPLKRFLESHPGTVGIATCRRAPRCGQIRGSNA
jgi:3-dehydroquinate dehydratase